MKVPPESVQAHDRRFNSKGVPVVLAVLYFPRIGGAVKFMRLGTREMQLLRLLAPRDTSPSTVAWPQAPVSHQSHYWRNSCCPTWLLRVIFEAFEGLRNPITRLCSCGRRPLQPLSAHGLELVHVLTKVHITFTMQRIVVTQSSHHTMLTT